MSFRQGNHDAIQIDLVAYDLPKIAGKMKRLQAARGIVIVQLGVAEDQQRDCFARQGVGQICEHFEDGDPPLVLIEYKRRSR